MQTIYKVLVPIVVVIVLVVAIEILTVQKSIPPFTIETISSTCMSEEHDLDVRAEGDSIVIIAPMQTPNPCYSVAGDVKFSGRDIEVDLSAVSKQTVCIQCVGEVTGKVVIQNLTKGTYSVKVKTPEKVAITSILIG